MSDPIDISIPVLFNEKQPSFFGAPPASSVAYKSNGFVGDTRQGGSCNVNQFSFITHCNGTHTECVGHIVNQRISIQNILQEVWIPTTLMTVNPQKANSSSESYVPQKQNQDLLITENELKNGLKNESGEEFLNGLILRTLPNDSSKMSRNYNQYAAPFFSLEAMQYIVNLGVTHLLVDIPSVDRANDEGKMSCHHIFWGVEVGTKDINEKNSSKKTITEMIYIPDFVEDGRYLVNIQIPSFVSDAAPSRPLLFKILELK